MNSFEKWSKAHPNSDDLLQRDVFSALAAVSGTVSDTYVSPVMRYRARFPFQVQRQGAA